MNNIFFFEITCRTFLKNSVPLTHQGSFYRQGFIGEVFVPVMQTVMNNPKLTGDDLKQMNPVINENTITYTQYLHNGYTITEKEYQEHKTAGNYYYKVWTVKVQAGMLKPATKNDFQWL